MNKRTYRKVQIEGEKVEERGRGGEKREERKEREMGGKMRHGDGRQARS